MWKDKRCIGVFTASLDDAYQSTIWHAIGQHAKERGFGSISFLGSRIGSPIATEAASNLAYHLANQRNIDGLIIIASAIATFLTSVDLRQFFSHWSDIPCVSIGMRVPGLSDVVVGGSEGITSLVEHLIDEHGRTHFALIDGPSGHEEAVSRVAACRAILHSRGLGLDERLIVPGTFTQDSGAHAVAALCRKRIPFDGLICMNDRMALGALEELSRRGIRVPDDVSVIGFDGIESSKFTQPPLTTVVQPMHELGASAVGVLDRLMKGGEEEHLVLSCTTVIRESCGCKPRFSYTFGTKEIPRYASESEQRAIHDLIDLVRVSDYDGMIMRLNRAIDATCAESGAVGRWNEYLSVVEHTCANHTLPGSIPLTSLIGAARAFTTEKIGRYQAAKRVAVESSFDTLRRISAMLAGAFELPEMYRNLKRGLELFGFKQGYLVVFDGNRGRARLLMDVREDGESSHVYSRDFTYTELLPVSVGKAWRQGQWILMPLVHNDEPLGYLIVPVGIAIPALYDVLQEQLSSSLKGTLLLEQIRSHERNLADQVEMRTKDLIRTNKELSSEIKRRTELEREVMEISSKTMERIGQDLHDDLCQHLLGISLLITTVKSRAAEQNHVESEPLEHISELLAESITKIKTISRGLLPRNMQPHTFLEQVEALVGDTRRFSRVDLRLHADRDFEIEDADRALHIFRIIQEALTNAIKHAEAGHVEISLHTGVSGWEVKVRDNGIGLPKQIREDGLGLRIMRNRAEIAQVGLNITSSGEGTVVRIREREQA